MLGAAVLFLALMPAAGRAQNVPPGQTLPPGQTEDKKDHGSVGAFFDYTHLQTPSVNFFGVGGRMGFKLYRRIQLEAEVAYDFQKSVSQTVTAGSIANTTTSNVKVMHALFGPKVRIPHTKNFFFVAKVGLANFGVSGPATIGSFNNQIGNIVNGDKDMVIYPGAGAEFRIGRLDFRAEAGDEIVFLNNGHLNNFRATVGPQFRF